MKSILVIGMGEFGIHLAKKMQELGNDVMVVDRNPEIIEQVAPQFTDSLIGDCTNEAVLQSLGINNFDICFVTTGSDFQASLVITSLLKKLNAQYIVSKAKQEIQKELLYKIGANEVIYPEPDLAERLSIRYNANNIFDFIPVTDNYAIYEIPVPAGWVNLTIKEINVRQKFHVNIIAVKQGNSLNPAPGGDYCFQKDDHIVVIGESSYIFKIAGKS
ncbi:MAG TPA: TrkA family potassium uptake protein [Oscillospiraceae bacterium]|nr:TrkA family potassium uptake protein [Oscillospiraceae bacterium]HXK78512.1 TrkA family potassium uptake protein [Oscillospiraceae bacterium]